MRRAQAIRGTIALFAWPLGFFLYIGAIQLILGWDCADYAGCYPQPMTARDHVGNALVALVFGFGPGIISSWVWIRGRRPQQD
jgi:hypothetical protein